MAKPPTSMMMMAMTQANTGRSRKKFDNISYLRLLCFCCRLGFLRSIRTILSTGIKGDNLYGGAGPHFLHPLDDQTVSRVETFSDNPFVTDGTIDLERPLLVLIRSIHHQRDGSSFRAAGDCLLRDKNCLVNLAFLH